MCISCASLKSLKSVTSLFNSLGFYISTATVKLDNKLLATLNKLHHTFKSTAVA